VPIAYSTAWHHFLKADYAAIGMFFLLGVAQLAVGMLVSALTISQLVAERPLLSRFYCVCGIFDWHDSCLAAACALLRYLRKQGIGRWLAY